MKLSKQARQAKRVARTDHIAEVTQKMNDAEQARLAVAAQQRPVEGLPMTWLTAANIYQRASGRMPKLRWDAERQEYLTKDGRTMAEVAQDNGRGGRRSTEDDLPGQYDNDPRV